MRILLYVGGVRSGKSRLAGARAHSLGGSDVTFLATGRATDDELARRIEKHRAERPAEWETVEASGRVASALRHARHPTVLLDCLTFLVADALVAGEEQEDAALGRCQAAVADLLEAATSREGTLIVVSNEVGAGVVPTSPLGRWFRDAQGWANQNVAEAADEVIWVLCGMETVVKGESARPLASRIPR